MYELKSLIFLIYLLTAIGFIGSVWFACVLLKEVTLLKSQAKDVSNAFIMVTVEINKTLLNNNAIHYTDLMNIVRSALKLIPGVNIDVKKEYGDKRLDIVINSGRVTSTVSLMTTVIEYGKPKLTTQV
jgi:hypothetical protein